jgi:hypothetical protein
VILNEWVVIAWRVELGNTKGLLDKRILDGPTFCQV